MTGILCAAVLSTSSAYGQALRIGVYGADVIDKQVTAERVADGIGVGARVQWRPGRFAFEIDANTGSLSTGGGFAKYTSREIDLRVSYALTPWIAAETGIFGRTVSPDLFAQDVGAVRLGVLTENHVTRNATIRIRGAYLIAPRFSGGGDANFAFEFGVGAELGSASGRLALVADYVLERIDRVVTGEDVPIQYSAFRLGVMIGL